MPRQGATSGTSTSRDKEILSCFGLLRGPADLFILVYRTLRAWTDRAKARRQLAQMSERQIKDLGATRGDAVREINKRFWEA